MLSSATYLKLGTPAHAPTGGPRLRARPVPAQTALSPIDAGAFGLDHDHMLAIVDVYWQVRI